jgi:hypothetical protein
MLGFGEGIPPRDDVQAYKWLALAVANYTAKNQDRRDQAARDLATVRARLSPARIKEAEGLVRTFRPAP